MNLGIKNWQYNKKVFWSILASSLVINLLSVAFPITLLQIYDRILPNHALNTMVLLLIGVGIALIIESFLKILRFYLSGITDAQSEYKINAKAYAHITNLSLSNFEKESTGVYLKRLTTFSSMQGAYINQSIISLIDIPFLIIFLILIAYIASWLVLVTLFIIVGYILITVPHIKKLKTALERHQQNEDKRISYLIEIIKNIHSVKTLAMEKQIEKNYNILQEQSSISNYELGVINSKFSNLAKSLSQVMIVAVIGIGSLQVMNEYLTIGGLSACMLLSRQCILPLNSVVQVWLRLKTSLIAKSGLDELFKTPTEFKPGLPEWNDFSTKIELKNIKFKYSHQKHWLLKDINLTIKKNESISIDGSGQSGKTTLLMLILGMVEPAEGHITIDGKSISEFDKNSLRSHIAYLPPSPVLFNGSIIDNLSFFDKNLILDAKKAAVFTGIDPIVSELPKGYETIIADRTTEKLSCGINQRIAITRALVRKTPIVLFDEANTSLDLEGDADLKKLIQQLKGKTTLILVSNQQSILSMADKHYALKDGKLGMIS